MAGAFATLVDEEAPSTVALSGGSTARRCYEALARSAEADWTSCTVLFGDERWVDVDSADSNEGMARRVLLDAVEPAGIWSMRDAGATPEAAADAYERLVARLGGIDLVHLGLGGDGHTASLFPGSPALDVDDRLVVATGDAAHRHRRVTLTFPGIARARLAVVTASGTDKADAWRRLCRGDDVPAGRVRADRVVWLVDPAVVSSGPAAPRIL